MQSALEAIRQQAVKYDATRVSRVVLRVGSLAGVDLDALRFAYEALSPGSVAAGAELEIECVKARAHCTACRTDFAVGRSFICQCPACGTYSGDIRSGRELGIARLEFSDEDQSVSKVERADPSALKTPARTKLPTEPHNALESTRSTRSSPNQTQMGAD